MKAYICEIIATRKGFSSNNHDYLRVKSPTGNERIVDIFAMQCRCSSIPGVDYNQVATVHNLAVRLSHNGTRWNSLNISREALAAIDRVARYLALDVNAAYPTAPDLVTREQVYDTYSNQTPITTVS